MLRPYNVMYAVQPDATYGPRGPVPAAPTGRTLSEAGNKSSASANRPSRQRGLSDFSFSVPEKLPYGPSAMSALKAAFGMPSMKLRSADESQQHPPARRSARSQFLPH